MELANNVLKSYSGRDSCLRLINYSCLLMSSAVQNQELATKLETIRSELSNCQITLRLFDDLIMLRYSLMHGFNKEEPDFFLRWTGVINNIVDQIYYPIEHIAWAADKKLIKKNSTPWWNASTILWAVSLYIGIIRSIRILRILQNQRTRLDSSFNKLVLFEILTIIQHCCDLFNAIHWMPKGILWSRQLKQWQVGLFGVISSLLIFYKNVH